MRARRSALLGALVATLALAGPAQAAKPWACNGDRSLCDRPFDRVVLPATHNSMAAVSLGWATPSQPVGIPAQLRLGIRGLLIDTHYGHPQADGVVITDRVKSTRSRVYVCHTLCENGATPLLEVLASLRSFLRDHPHNVLLIDQEDYVSPQDFAREVARSGLRRYVYRGAPGPRWPTLRTMITRRQQVVLLAEHRARGVAWDHLAYAGVLQETPFRYDTPDELTDTTLWNASCAPKRGGNSGSLFLMNHWLRSLQTPATLAAVNATGALVGRALTCQELRSRMPTIVAVDMFRTGGLFPAVRKLNVLLGARR